MLSNTTDIQAVEAEACIQVSCYSLPYSGIGFTSHMITIYTMLAFVFGRKPLRPWKKLEHKKRGIILGAIQLIATTTLSSISIQ